MNISHPPRASLHSLCVALLVGLAVSATGCSKWSAERTIKGYLNQSTCSDRAQFILDPEANKQVLANHYQDTKDCKRTFTEIKAEECTKVADGGTCQVKVVFDPDDKQWYLLKKTTDGFKIDWRASVGYNPVSLVAFKTLPIGARSVFRATITLDTRESTPAYYTFQVDTPNKHVWSEVQRTSSEAQPLFAITQDGEQHRVMLELENIGTFSGREHVRIERLIQRGWETRTEELKPLK